MLIIPFSICNSKLQIIRTYCWRYLVFLRLDVTQWTVRWTLTLISFIEQNFLLKGNNSHKICKTFFKQQKQKISHFLICVIYDFNLCSFIPVSSKYTSLSRYDLLMIINLNAKIFDKNSVCSKKLLSKEVCTIIMEIMNLSTIQSHFGDFLEKHGDPRSENWWLIDSPFKVIGISLIYFVTVTVRNVKISLQVKITV